MKYYRMPKDSFMNIVESLIKGKNATIKLIKLKHQTNDSYTSTVSLILLPSDFFEGSNRSNSYLSATKSQLTQIFNYLKHNSSKRYQHFSKLITKRLPSTNLIAHLILENSACFIVNYVGEGSI